MVFEKNATTFFGRGSDEEVLLLSSASISTLDDGYYNTIA